MVNAYYIAYSWKDSIHTHTHSIPSILDGSNLKLTIHLVPNLGANKHYNINNNVISVVKRVPV